MNVADVVFLLILIGGVAASGWLYKKAQRHPPLKHPRRMERLLDIALMFTRIGGGAAILATPAAMLFLSSHSKVLDWLSFVIVAGSIALLVGSGVLGGMAIGLSRTWQVERNSFGWNGTRSVSPRFLSALASVLFRKSDTSHEVPPHLPSSPYSDYLGRESCSMWGRDETKLDPLAIDTGQRRTYLSYFSLDDLNQN